VFENQKSEEQLLDPRTPIYTSRNVVHENPKMINIPQEESTFGKIAEEARKIALLKELEKGKNK
jgi:hypothetical protein